ncbi:hypothetical protein A2397_06260 [Candidatus Amesbacteria bacterium RIFOXYB1_FULL_44_23]|uniref:AAA+ ATPase domain-containing protein n=1 Tax=Candidatus Amesbacteria bacterium RIFOXYB1_FULL_44_23 TaxID=1797263 RepID=A0A1F4ZTY3_9BACT|nr:MAG: hypothetical protein A2397_06260 [Candidatus Amesbacteria bacterium RIFOXYB1_FULL_44_23]
MNPYTDQQLYDFLSELGIVDSDKLSTAFELAKSKEVSLADQLLENDLITDENLGKLLADMLELPFIRLEQVSIPKEVLQILPEVVAKNQKAVVFALDDKGAKMAMVNPGNKEFIDLMAKKIGEKVKVYLATPRDIEAALSWYKKDLQKSFDELMVEKVEAVQKGTGGEIPAIEIVNLLVEYAHDNRASDVHIEPRRKLAEVRFRIDGVLHDVLNLPLDVFDQVVTRIKVASKLRTDEHMAAQDGKMQVETASEELDIRVSVVPLVHGEKVVMRLLSSKSRQFGLADLGLSEEDLNKIKDGFMRPYGMVLVTGPTGSGKTTSIYAILKILNSRDVNIATIEDPVEYDIEGINQIQVNPKAGLTFASGLRSILRQDPNVIFVGEIRDEETADISVNSAMTGHLVLSTLHTNDAATTLPRLIEMKIEPYIVASTVNVITAQRLVRKICEKCRVSTEISMGDLQKKFPAAVLAKHFGKNLKKVRVYIGKGCPVCHKTGYAGRIGIYEVLVVSEDIKELIMAKADAGTIQKKAVAEGMNLLWEDGLEKVREGITTLDEVLRVTRD